MAALPNYVEPFMHRHLGGDLVVSVCAQCGLVVAGSPRESLLFLVERLHACPVYLNYHSR